jgi:3-oxoadipate enol-lactonase
MKNRSYLQRFGEVELVVQQLGDGLPFVWGHSLLGSMAVEDRAALWDWDELEDIAGVVRYDARGHGNSDGSYDPQDYCWDQMARDMLSVAECMANDREVDRYVLGGISMGAATALQAAVSQPDRVAGLVLVLPPTAWETRPRQAAIYRRMSWVSGLLGAAPFRVLDWLPVPVRRDGRSRLSLSTARGMARANPLHVQAALRGAALSDMPEKSVLAKLEVPTLILAWEDDAAHPVSTAMELAETLPEVHALVVSDPVDIADWMPALRKFLKRVVPSRKRKASAAPRRRRTTANKSRHKVA